MRDDKAYLAKHKKLFNNLLSFLQKSLNYQITPKLSFIQSKANSDNPLGKTGFYDPSDHKIVIYITDRHVKDIMRSLSHEIVHHHQNCRGDFHQTNLDKTLEGNYAQTDTFLRELEREAYEQGNMLFRTWEAQIKKEEK